MISLTRKQARQIHAKNRAMERYNLNFSEEIRENFLNKIKSQIAILIFHQSLSKSLFLIDKKYYVVYGRKSKEILTFLSSEMIGNTIITNQIQKEKNKMQIGFIGIGNSLK